jgi:hypothetical protein
MRLSRCVCRTVGPGLHGERKEDRAVHDARRSLRARRSVQTAIPVRPAATLDGEKSSLDLNTPFNFVSTNDIIGGNSGSPTINQNGELVGLIFDGNIQSLVGDFMYDGSVNRAISVDSRGMLEVLKKVFDAKEVVAELTTNQVSVR